jgi:hypothetical protein
METANRAVASGDNDGAVSMSPSTSLLARLVDYVTAVEEALMQTEVGRNAWPRYAERLREAGEALKRECANTQYASNGGISAEPTP